MVWKISQRIVLLAVFLSGFAALIYQLIWVRLLGLVFGVSSFAVATVVAVFLIGLGLGSYCFGKWSEKWRDPLKAYAFVECAIAAFSVLSYLLINKVQLYEIIYRYSYNNMGLYGMSLVRLVLSGLILMPPVFAIGGTMPLISKYHLTASTTFGSRFSILYYVNTLGAFSGALLTGFFLVRYVGVFLTLMIAVGLNLLIVLMLCAGKSEAEQAIEPADHVGESSPYSYMLVILFVTGFISLSYEILWTRILSTYGVATSQAFALILSGFLLGFAVGSWAVARRIDQTGGLGLLFGRASILTAVSGAAVLFTFQRFEASSSFLARTVGISTANASLWLAFALSLVPAIFMGMLFPLGLRIYSRDVKKIGVKIGNVFLFNTLGAVLGSVLAGFALIPFVGMWNTTLILINLSLAISFYVFSRNGHVTKANAVVLLLVFLAANAMVFFERKAFHRGAKNFDLIYYSEGLSGTVTVLERDDVRGLVVDGEYVAGTDPVLTIDSKMLAHLPLMLADNPKKALTVGYGAGGTSYSMLLHGVDVHAVEIEEKIVEASRLFEKINSNAIRNPRLKLVLDDARNYINATEERFDVIVTDVTNLKYKRNPYLYTKEYFEIMKDALEEHGLAAAWLPVGGLSFGDLKILISTFQSVYPHTTVWYFSQYPTHFITVVGTQERLSVELSDLDPILEKVEEDLFSIGVDSEFELANMLLLGEKDVNDLVSEQDVHTDDLPILEFSDMHSYMRTDVHSNLSQLLRYQREDLMKYFIVDSSEVALLKRYLKSAQSFWRDYAGFEYD